MLAVIEVYTCALEQVIEFYMVEATVHATTRSESNVIDSISLLITLSLYEYGPGSLASASKPSPKLSF